MGTYQAIILAVFLILTGCTHSQYLSAAEKQKYQLNGQVSNVEICPMSWDSKTQSQVKTGPCQWVRCEEVQGLLQCQIQKQPFN